MQIVIDTREKKPWSFPPDVSIEFATLKSGDYALKNDSRFAIERKSGEDLAGTLSSGWERFLREIKRMEEYQFESKIIIVEADFEYFCFKCKNGIILPPDHEHVRCSPQFLMKRISELSFMNVSVLFAGNIQLASALAFKIFIEREKRLKNEDTSFC